MVINHNFKTQAIIAIIAVIVSGSVGILSALRGLGVWALVSQTLTSGLITMLLYWILSKWRPLWAFSVESFKKLFSFGSKILLSGILESVYSNLYNLVIGKVYSPNELGFFTKAKSITTLPTSSLAFTLQGAIYPFLCEAQNDKNRLKQLFLTYTKMIAFVIFPIVCCVFVLAEPFVLALLTEKWLPAVPLIKILIFAYALYPLCYINCQALNVKGRSDLFLKTDIIVKIVSVIILAVSAPFGIKSMCWSLIVFYVINYLIVTYNVKKVIAATIFEQIVAILPSFCIAAISGVITYITLLFIENVWVELFIGGAVLVVSYFIIARLLRLKELDRFKIYVVQILNRNKK